MNLEKGEVKKKLYFQLYDREKKLARYGEDIYYFSNKKCVQEKILNILL